MRVTLLMTPDGKWWAVVTHLRVGSFFAQGPIRDTIEEAEADGRRLACSILVSSFEVPRS